MKWKSDDRPNILLCCSGSVATLKVPELISKLAQIGTIRFVATPAAHHFLQRAELYNPSHWKQFESIGGMSLEIRNEDEWKLWDKLGDPVLHIELRKWANVIIVAPASADFLAKISAGISDNLALSVLRAWDFEEKPCVYLCPAMNTAMWRHPATRAAVDILSGWGYNVVEPVSKTLACKDVGVGALAPVMEIVDRVANGWTAHCRTTSRRVEDTTFIDSFLAQTYERHTSIEAVDTAAVTNANFSDWLTFAVLCLAMILAVALATID